MVLRPSYFVAKSVRRFIISREHVGFTQKKGNRVSHIYIDDGRHIGEREAVLCDQGDLSRQRRLQALLQGVGGGVPAGVAAMRGLTGEFLLPPLKKRVQSYDELLPFFSGHGTIWLLQT